MGRAVFGALAARHEVIGLDRSPFSTTTLVGDIADAETLQRAVDGGVDAVVHTAALHAPHVGLVLDAAFERVNVEATQRLADAARAAGAKTFVFTSTTALYGDAVEQGACTWIDESTEPQPRTIYHRTKLAAEAWLQTQADDEFAVRVLRMSRSFPEQPDAMAVFRLHRGVDVRDVGEAHAAALLAGRAAFQRYVVSGDTPFLREDVDALATRADAVLRLRCPALVEAFTRRGWPLPRMIDRVYEAGAALRGLGWRARFGFEEVLRQCDAGSIEVLPWMRDYVDRTRE